MYTLITVEILPTGIKLTTVKFGNLKSQSAF